MIYSVKEKKPFRQVSWLRFLAVAVRLGLRVSSELGVELRGEVFEDGFAVFGFQGSAPARHFVDFAIPLRGREPLLHHHAFVVAGEAGGLIAGGMRGRARLVGQVDQLLRGYL